MRLSYSLFTLTLLLLFISLQGCSGGGSSSDSAGISCTEIVGQYNMTWLLGDGSKESGVTTVQNDCSITSQGEKTGVTSGTLTSRDGNVYWGRASNTNFCPGQITIKMTFLDDGSFKILNNCI